MAKFKELKDQVASLRAQLLMKDSRIAELERAAQNGSAIRMHFSVPYHQLVMMKNSRETQSYIEMVKQNMYSETAHKLRTESDEIVRRCARIQIADDKLSDAKVLSLHMTIGPGRMY